MHKFIFIVAVVCLGALAWLYFSHTSVDQHHSSQAQSLMEHRWQWVYTEYPDTTTVAPNQTEAFGLLFELDNRLSITTDCNSMSARYALDGDLLSVAEIASTLMYCEESQEQIFSEMVSEAYRVVVAENELQLHLQTSGGVMYFESVAVQ